MEAGFPFIVSNIWAYLNKEWDGAKGPFGTFLLGLLVLIVATIVLGYSNGLS